MVENNLNASQKTKERVWLNLILVGKSDAGKTSLMNRHVKKKFNENEKNTIGCGFAKCIYKSKDGSTAHFKIWDTAGQERFGPIVRTLLDKQDGFIFVYDLTVRESFIEVSDWIQSARKAKGAKDTDGQPVPMVMVGNKLDLCKPEDDERPDSGQDLRRVSFEEGKRYARDHSMPFFEASAKADIGVKDFMDNIMERVYQEWLQKNSNN